MTVHSDMHTPQFPTNTHCLSLSLSLSRRLLPTPLFPGLLLSLERKMKKEHHHHQNSQLLPPLKRRLILSRAAAVILVFSLGYVVGILTSSPRASVSSSPDTQLLLQLNTVPSPPNRPTDVCNDSPKEGKEEQDQLQQLQPPTTTKKRPQSASPPPPHDFFRFRTQCAPALPQDEILPTLLDRVYNGTSPYAGFPPAHAAGLLRKRRLRGWGSTAPVFRELIESVRPRTIVEVGTFLGASALHMANLTSGRLGALILCLDDFRGWPGFRRPPRANKADLFKDLADVNGDVTLMYQFMQNVAAAGEEGRVLPVPFSTAAGLAALCEWGVYGDLVEVDAGHDFHSAWQDINMAWAVLRPGGVMFGHDYHNGADNRGVRRAVDLFARSKGLRVLPNGQHWVLQPPKPHY